jgi:hypothetical protein
MAEALLMAATISHGVMCRVGIFFGVTTLRFDTNILLNFLRVATFVHQLCNMGGLGAVRWILGFFFCLVLLINFFLIIFFFVLCGVYRLRELSLLGCVWCGKLGSWCFDLFRSSLSLRQLDLATLSLENMIYVYIT